MPQVVSEEIITVTLTLKPGKIAADLHPPVDANFIRSSDNRGFAVIRTPRRLVTALRELPEVAALHYGEPADAATVAA